MRREAMCSARRRSGCAILRLIGRVDGIGEVIEVSAVACADGVNQDFGPCDPGQFGDRGDVEVDVEGVGVGEQEVRAQRDVDGSSFSGMLGSDAARYRVGVGHEVCTERRQ